MAPTQSTSPREPAWRATASWFLAAGIFVYKTVQSQELHVWEAAVILGFAAGGSASVVIAIVNAVRGSGGPQDPAAGS